MTNIMRERDLLLPEVCIDLERWMSSKEVGIQPSFIITFVVRIHQIEYMLHHPICMLTVMQSGP